MSGGEWESCGAPSGLDAVWRGDPGLRSFLAFPGLAHGGLTAHGIRGSRGLPCGNWLRGAWGISGLWLFGGGDLFLWVVLIWLGIVADVQPPLPGRGALCWGPGVPARWGGLHPRLISG